MNGVYDFYEKQDAWSGLGGWEVNDLNRANAADIIHFMGKPTGSVLELGAGGGQNAAASAQAGLTVTAIELIPALAEKTRKITANLDVTVINGDFYTVQIDQTFDAVTYWDGFGIGEDADQVRLLKRIHNWLKPDGVALIDVYTPWYWEKAAGRQMPFGEVERVYGYDSVGNRMLDTWWHKDRRDDKVMQSLRCYAPDELAELLTEAGLQLVSTKAKGAYYPDENRFDALAPLEEAMSYLAVIKKNRK